MERLLYLVELERFNELEEKVKAVVEEYSILRKRNLELERLLEGANTELENARTRIRMLNQEKDVVRTKVDALLDMLSHIEEPQ